MYPDAVLRYAGERHLSVQDAAQTFLQVVVLRHLSLSEARFMGGTALVLGYNNPRFSEDVDLTQVDQPQLLQPGLLKAKKELEGWFQTEATLRQSPKSRTWRLVLPLSPSETLQLHVDSQPYRALTHRPLVIEYPSIQPFVCAALELDEIMAEKVVALAFRRYLGGRDLFDLWFHWLKNENWRERQSTITKFMQEKLRERSLQRSHFQEKLAGRLSERVPLDRAKQEWQRYLPADFQKEAVFQEILTRCRLLGEIRL